MLLEVLSGHFFFGDDFLTAGFAALAPAFVVAFATVFTAALVFVDLAFAVLAFVALAVVFRGFPPPLAALAAINSSACASVSSSSKMSFGKVALTLPWRT